MVRDCLKLVDDTEDINVYSLSGRLLEQASRRMESMTYMAERETVDKNDVHSAFGKEINELKQLFGQNHRVQSRLTELLSQLKVRMAKHYGRSGQGATLPSRVLLWRFLLEQGVQGATLACRVSDFCQDLALGQVTFEFTCSSIS